MTNEWQQTLLGEADLVKRAAATVPGMLAHPAITLDQVSRLRGHVHDCIVRLRNLLADMKLVEVDQVWIEAAQTIQYAWESLARDAAERQQSFETAILDVRHAHTDSPGGHL
ncbi:hypothetical protein [Sinorhizobium fredii]|uniref:hypothetical protein n=1 Tax=Rhizobium fredii TaxID=380 RepID=UPI00056B4939|nr:hypothetical protein [Sinorhizobium fredii]